MTIIPQDPFIFAGSVRDNLDPLRQRDDSNIWELVKELNLVPFVDKLGGILAHINDVSSSLSVGEKQLICLMRAILRNSKVSHRNNSRIDRSGRVSATYFELSIRQVVCIDEATANIDLETDKRIRNVIKNAFTASTVLIIAHRVETILDCDR